MKYSPPPREESARQHSAPVAAEHSLEQTVFVIDDDPQVRAAVATLLESVAQPCRPFSSADDFLQTQSLDEPGCLVCDIRMPGLNGLELQRRLAELGCELPIIFVSGYGDVPMAVKAIRNGAISFLQKPFREQELLGCVQIALEKNRKHWSDCSFKREVSKRIKSLTGRESEVFKLIVAGMANKRAAEKLGVSQRTVEIHRSRVMQKMHAKSLAELVRMHKFYLGR